MHIPQMISRSPLCLLGLLGLTLFASPVAAQVFDSRPSDPALFDNSPVKKRITFTVNGSSVSPGSIVGHINQGTITPEDVDGTFVIFQSVQSMTGRNYTDGKWLELKKLAPSVRSVVSARWDLLYNGKGPVAPGTPLEFWNTPVKGPVWDFLPAIAGGDPMPTPSIAVQGKERNGVLYADAKAAIEAQGWTILNETSVPWPYGLPYEVRFDPVARTLWYNQQKVDLRSQEWKVKMTDFLAAYETYVQADGVFLNFPKPQNYGNKDDKTIIEFAFDGNLDEMVNHYSSTNKPRFGHVIETPYEWFKAMEKILWMMMQKKTGIAILDFSNATVPAYRYSKQIIQEWATTEGVSEEVATDRYWQAMKDLGEAADYVIKSDGVPASSDPKYAVPSDFWDTFNLIEDLNF